ncbi:MAG: PRC-barrel domain-containing protein, partial [Bacilli bacterium]|nr:PRC-barrel domain-containing protein [Bacilli bacterium]
LLSYNVISKDGRVGTVKEVFFASPTNKIIRIQLDKEYLIPYHSPLVVEISKERCELIVDIME